MKRAENIPDKSSPKGPIRSDNSGAGLAIGLSLGVLFGVLTDNIGLGMMIGTAVGLCGGSASGAWRGKKVQEDHQDEERP